MRGEAVVRGIVAMTQNARQLALRALHSAKLSRCLEFYGQRVKFSMENVDGGLMLREASYVSCNPRLYVLDPSCKKPVQMIDEVLHPLRVSHLHAVSIS
jgi:hypothetical protein